MCLKQICGCLTSTICNVVPVLETHHSWHLLMYNAGLIFWGVFYRASLLINDRIICMFLCSCSGKKGKEKKAKKEASIKSLSEANSKLWETRLELTEQSLNEYRDNARKLLLENDTLQNQVSQTEKDTIDVITYLKRQDQDKDRQVRQHGFYFFMKSYLPITFFVPTICYSYCNLAK